MDNQIKEVNCGPECGFLIRSHDEKELIEIVKAHAKNVHNMTITEEDVRVKMKTV
jgi:predicted small metal-binding protein